MGRVRAWAVLFALTLVLPLAAHGAQAQLGGTCGPVSIATTPEEVSLEPGGNATVDVAVTNDGSLDGSARLDLSVPQGWDVQPAERTFGLAAGATETVTVTVKASTDADRFSPPYNLDATASLDCGAAGASDPATATVGLALDTGGGAGGTGGDDGGPGLGTAGLVFLGAVAVLTVLGALPWVQSRRALRVEAKEPLLGVEPGEGVSFPVEVENRGKEPDTVRFDMDGVPDGWSAFIAVPSLDLDAGEHRTLWVLVRSPPDARAGDVATVNVHAASETHSERSVTVDLTAKVSNGPTDEPMVGTMKVESSPEDDA